MRLWVCDLVVILEGFFSSSFFRLLVVNGDEIVGWVCDLVMILVAGGHGCGWW